MKASTFFKIGLTIILFIVLFTRLSLSSIVQTFTSLNVPYYLIGFCCVPVLYAIRTYKWEILLNSIDIRKPFSELFQVLLIGVFYGLITPGKVGELGRAYHLNERKTLTLSTILIEKITDILVLVLLSFLTVVLFFEGFSSLISIILICGLVVAASTALLTNHRFVSIAARLFKIDKENVQPFTDSFLHLIKKPQTMVQVVALTFLYYGVAYLLGTALAFALGIEWVATTTLPLIVLMGNVPITISGLGVRESLGAFSFILLGLDGVYGFSYSLLLFITITIIPGIGGYFLRMKTEYDNNRVDEAMNSDRGQITGILSPILESWRMNEIKRFTIGNRILDFGCGYGKFATLIPDKEYIGIDIDLEVICSAKQLHQNRKNVQFYTLEEFKMNNQLFDSIVLAAVLEHLDNPIQLLGELKSCLSKGGRIIITTPTPLANTILEFGSKFRLFSREAVEEHNHLFEKDDLTALSRQIGMKLERYERFELGMNQLAVFKNE